MATTQRRGGIIQVQVDGRLLEARGNWTYGLGTTKKDEIMGVDSVHGYKEMAQAPFIEGEITDSAGLDLAALLGATGATVTLTLANGKLVALHDAWQAGEGTGNTEEGNVQVKFVGLTAHEVL